MFTVGDILRKTREKNNISLVDVEKNIKIREKYLKAIENNNWSMFSSKIYITGIIKNYSRFLKLDEKKVLAFFRRDYEKKDDVSFREKVEKRYLVSESKQLFYFGLGLSFILILAYFSFQLKTFLSPPALTILQPTTINFMVEKKIEIIGKTEKDTTVLIGGDKIETNKGIFKFSLPLKDGNNSITFDLIGANGKKTVVTKTFTKTPVK